MDLINLTYDERSELESALFRDISSKEFQRAQAILLIDEGTSIPEVADLLRVSRQTVYNWVARFQSRRSRPVPQRLSDAPRDGRPATISDIIDDLLDEIIDTDPRIYGYRSTVWTAELFQQYLSDFFQIAAGRRSVQYALKRLRVTWKRPRHSLALREEHWRQAKGASNVASGRARGRSF
jgi:transposase